MKEWEKQTEQTLGEKGKGTQQMEKQNYQLFEIENCNCCGTEENRKRVSVEMQKCSTNKQYKVRGKAEGKRK